tara:strand:+ start:440 stop:664 length:225 start_codon:yes stop_codon:yes gene_type:complete
MSRTPDYYYYQTFDVTVYVTYEKKYKIRAMNEDHALALAKNRLKKRRKSTDRKGLNFIDVVGSKIKRIREEDDE